MQLIRDNTFGTNRTLMLTSKHISAFRRLLAVCLTVFLSGDGPASFAQVHSFVLPPANNTLVNTAYQRRGPYHVLTPQAQYRIGTLWSPHKFNLNQVFDSTFYLHFGYETPDVLGGADGIVFIFQNMHRPDSIPGRPFMPGRNGGMLGYGSENDTTAGLGPSIDIEFDTYCNNYAPTLPVDTVVDHIDIFAHGAMFYNNVSRSLIGRPVQASPTSDNIEDGLCHKVRILWVPDNDGNATDTSRLSVYFDNMATPRCTLNRNIRNDIGTSAWWGFTAATGKSTNRQYITFLDLPDTSSCKPIVLGHQLYHDSTGQITYEWTDPDLNVVPGRLITAVKSGRYIVRMSLDSFCTISDTVNVVTDTCCRNCTTLFSNYDYFRQVRLYTYKEGMPGFCCYEFIHGLFSPVNIAGFNCPPYGMRVRIPAMHDTLLNHLDTKELTDGHLPPDFFDLCIGKEKFVSGKAVIVTEFLSASGRVMCTRTDTLTSCDNCCDSMVVRNEMAAAGGNCSGTIFFGIPEGSNACGITGVKTSVPGYPDNRPGYSIGYSFPYCLTTGQFRIYTGYFVNAAGDTVCRKSTIVACEGVSCCEALQVQLKHHTNPLLWHPCCYQYHLNLNPCYRCNNVFTIREKNGDTLLHGHSILNTVPPLGAPSLVIDGDCNFASVPVEKTLELLNASGDVICTIPLQFPKCDKIPPIGPTTRRTGGNGDKALHYLKTAPNPSTGSFEVSFDIPGNSTVVLQISDAAGRLVESRELHVGAGQTTETFQAATWSNGLYFVKLITPGDTRTSQVIIRH